jgi:hypothetical protein
MLTIILIAIVAIVRRNIRVTRSVRLTATNARNFGLVLLVLTLGVYVVTPAITAQLPSDVAHHPATPRVISIVLLAGGAIAAAFALQDQPIGEGADDLRTPFGFLEDFGFRLVSFDRSFDNFVGEYRRDDIRIQITRDRKQVFVELGSGEELTELDVLLAAEGFARERFPDRNGLWTGYDLENQVQELRTHLPLLLQRLTEPRP